MQRLAIKYPSSFMILLFTLSNDEKSRIIAEKIYKQYIDKDIYPYEIIKQLREYKLNDRGCMNNGIQFPKLNGFANYVEVTNGYVSMVVHNRNHYYRNDINFYHLLLVKLQDLSENSIDEIISFLEVIQYDKICVEIAKNAIKHNIKMHEDKITKLKELL